jgi:hypothetical protein
LRPQPLGRVQEDYRNKKLPSDEMLPKILAAHFPTNFQSVGYIEFDVDTLEAKTADLLKELIGFGLVRVMPT